MVIKILQALWPFIKEMVLGDRSLKQAISSNKKRVLFIVLILTSIALNIVTIPRLLNIAKQHLVMVKEMERKDKEIEELKKSKEVKKPKPEIVVDNATPVRGEHKVKRQKSQPSHDRTNSLRQKFDEIKSKEQDG